MSDIYEGFAFKTFGGYSITPTSTKGKLSFDLDVDSFDSYYGPESIDLDALEVYKNLKEYFKGTKYE